MWILLEISGGLFASSSFSFNAVPRYVFSFLSRMLTKSKLVHPVKLAKPVSFGFGAMPSPRIQKVHQSLLKVLLSVFASKRNSLSNSGMRIVPF